MPWADTTQEQFDLVNRFTTDETKYYGPYNTLLNDLFPHSEHFQVVHQYKGPVIPGSVNFIYIVRKRKCPVSFIEIKPFVHLDDISTREKADQQMRDGFVSIIGRGNLVIPKLYGISAMGSRYSVYEYTKETNIPFPPPIARRDVMFVTDVAPADRWNYELLEENGELKTKTIFVSIKEMCAEFTKCTSTSYIFSDHSQLSVCRVAKFVVCSWPTGDRESQLKKCPLGWKNSYHGNCSPSARWDAVTKAKIPAQVGNIMRMKCSFIGNYPSVWAKVCWHGVNKKTVSLVTVYCRCLKSNFHRRERSSWFLQGYLVQITKVHDIGDGSRIVRLHAGHGRDHICLELYGPAAYNASFIVPLVSLMPIPPFLPSYILWSRLTSILTMKLRLYFHVSKAKRKTPSK